MGAWCRPNQYWCLVGDIYEDCGDMEDISLIPVSEIGQNNFSDRVKPQGETTMSPQARAIVGCLKPLSLSLSFHSLSQVLLEAMEQQSVSVAKGGMVASLPARTTILAAANPAEGHYNKAKSVCANLKMSPAMLSRFDLIFILLDKPDEALDQALSEHVMALHSGEC